MNEIIQRASNAFSGLPLPLNNSQTTFRRCLARPRTKNQGHFTVCSDPYCEPPRNQSKDTRVECIEFILPRCCESLSSNQAAARKLTVSEAAQSNENLDWIFELVNQFPKVIVSVHYKCAWCFPASLHGTLNSKDRRVLALQRAARSASSLVAPFCSTKGSQKWRLFACPGPAQRIREIASFDDESTGNTKEIGAYLRHAINRREEGYADFSVFIHSDPAPHLGTGLLFTRFLLWAHGAVASPADVPFLQINYRYKRWSPRKNLECAWNTVFPGSLWNESIYDVSLAAAAQFVVNRESLQLRDPAVFERVLGLPGCRDCKSQRTQPLGASLELMPSCSIRFNADWSQSSNYAANIEQLWGFIFPVAIEPGQETSISKGDAARPSAGRFSVPPSASDPRLRTFLSRV